MAQVCVCVCGRQGCVVMERIFKFDYCLIAVFSTTVLLFNTRLVAALQVNMLIISAKHKNKHAV